MPIGIYIEYTPHADKFDELLARLKEESRTCLREDDGCLRMELAVPEQCDGRILLSELWRDRAAIESHRNQPGHSHAWQEPLIASKRVTVCKVLTEMVNEGARPRPA